ncbi:hypothetical protein Bca4012_065385 [Brassica carinata]
MDDTTASSPSSVVEMTTSRPAVPSSGFLYPFLNLELQPTLCRLHPPAIEHGGASCPLSNLTAVSLLINPSFSASHRNNLAVVVKSEEFSSIVIHR